MTDKNIHMVTGAFGYSGKFLAHKLLDAGHVVETLTNKHPAVDPFEGKIKAHAWAFDDPAKLVEILRPVKVLYNSYWVRFNHKRFTFKEAVANSKILFQAAKEAGVERIVHTSITKPSKDSPYEYFRGKAEVEKALFESGLSHAILRPAVFFGGEDILVNNIAWALRKLPVFGVFGSGDYKLQPIFVGDFAELAKVQGESRENTVIDTTGPETFTYRELAKIIGEIIGVRRPVLSVPKWFGYLAGKGVGALTGDVTLTWEEIGGLSDGLLATDSPAAGTTKLTDWAKSHAATLGKKYASELARRRA